jgi:hypothetical protein
MTSDPLGIVVKDLICDLVQLCETGVRYVGNDSMSKPGGRGLSKERKPATARAICRSSLISGGYLELALPSVVE